MPNCSFESLFLTIKRSKLNEKKKRNEFDIVLEDALGIHHDRFVRKRTYAL